MSDIKFQKAVPQSLGAEKIARPSISYFADAWQRLRRNPVAMVSLVLIILFFFLAVFGSSLRGLDYTRINAKAKNQGISAQFWFGADDMGRDLFSNLWLGLRVSLIVALVCGFIQIVAGSLIGGIMGYFGGVIDIAVMRVIEIISAVPSLLVTMIIMMVLGNGVFSLLVAISVTSWCGTARQIRGQVMQLREIEYILAAEVIGASSFRTILKHLLPNTVGIIIVNLTCSIPTYIFIESGLSFVGLGLQPPNISLGTLIASGQVHMDFSPHQLFFPCLILCLTVLAFNLLGDGLRNALDPRLRR
ncbi:MAG: ABC transporter permease [Treponema sp.]|jgi:oligopeptide transport system permease protein|nr:ABC transporter permease [Treponema sp.]